MKDTFFAIQSIIENAQFAIVGILASIWRYLDPEKESLTSWVKFLRGIVGAAAGVVVGWCAPDDWELQYKLSVAAAFAAFQREIIAALKSVVISKIK